MYYKNLSAVQAIAATGGGVDTDISAYVGKARFIFAILNTAGTLPTLDRKIQASVAPVAGWTYTTLGTTTNIIDAGASTTVYQGVKFTNATAGQIKTVDFWLKKAGTIATGKKLTLKVEADNAGSPSGTALGTSATVDIDTKVATTGQWVSFTFTTPVDVAASTIYHLVLSADYNASGSNYVSMTSTTVASGGTQESFDGSSTWSLTSTEKVMVQVHQYAFADVTTLVATQATAAVSVNESVEIDTDAMASFVRVYDTIGGTAGPSFVASTSFVCGRQVQSG